MGERLERWRVRLSSDRAERTFTVIVVGSAPIMLGVVVVPWGATTDWSVAWPVLAIYVVGSLAGGTCLVALLSYWRPRQLRWLRQRFSDLPSGVLAFFASYGLLFSLVFVPAFTETYVCERGDGIPVRTSWTESRDNGTKAGVYTVDGQTYDIVVNAEEYLVRQTAPEQPPTADNDYYVRTYRVPWEGALMVCGTRESSDRDDLIGLGFASSIGFAAGVGGFRTWWRRRRQGR
jgi:hypothetical protein